MKNDESLPKSIFLKKDYRINLFCRIYEKEKSLRGIARVMGYDVRPGVNGVIRNIWLGKNCIPDHRMVKIMDYLKISKKEINQNISKLKENDIISDWYESYLMCIKDKPKK
jgi:hypothetical protein